MTFRIFAAFVILWLGVLTPQVSAQNFPSSAPVATSDQGASAKTNPFNDPAAWPQILETTEQAIAREGVTDKDLDRLFDETATIREAALERWRKLQPELEQARQQLDQLGPAPGEGEPAETDEVKNRREQLNENFSKIDAQLKQAKLAEVRANQILKSIADIRRDRFVKSVSVKSEGLLTYEFWSDFASGFSGFGRSFNLLIADSYKVFLERITSGLHVLLPLAFFLFLTGFVYSRVARFLDGLSDYSQGLLGYERAGNNPAAFMYYVRQGIMPGLMPLVLYWILSGLGLLTPRLDQLLFTVAMGIGFAIAVRALLRAFLAPQATDRRIVLLQDAAAKRILYIFTGLIIVGVLLVILKRIAVVLVTPFEVSVGLSLVFALIAGVTSIWILIVARADRRDQVEKSGQSIARGRFWRILTGVVWIIAIAILLSAITGYLAVAEFLSEQLLFGLVVVLSAWLLLRFVDHVFLYLPVQAYGEDSESTPEKALHGTSGQLMILAAGIAKAVIYLIAAILMALPWGYRTSDFFEFFSQIFFGFEIGGFSFSLSTILVALLVFVIGYAITAGFRNWLNNKLLPTTNLDIGISNSISTVFGYAGFLLAAIFAITAAGFDLSNLAIVAGALSVGVGFGLQSIVNNFVSGLILLAERPIKAGDWVVTSGGEGYVKKISVRSTEIETFDRATVIVPNSTLITDNVTNWTHGNKSGRIIVAVGVGYDSDPEKVEEILLRCAKEHRQVLGRPEPAVYFMDFGASSLDFQLRCFLGDINYSLAVTSELRFSIFRELKAEGIEIPFPQQDVHIKSNAAAEPEPRKRKTTKRSTSRSK